MAYISDITTPKEQEDKYELKKKNIFSLLDDSNLDSHLKTLKIGDKLTPIQLSDSEIRFNADFSLDGKFKLHTLEADNQYMSVVVSGGGGTDVTYFEVNADYIVHRTKTGQFARETYNVTGDNYQFTRGGLYDYVHLGNYNFHYWNYILGTSRPFVKFNAGQNAIQIMDDADDGDMLKLAVDTAGASTISTIDDDGTAGHLTLDADGAINIDSVNTANSGTDGTLFKTNGTTFGSITSHHSLSTLYLFEAGGSSTDDYFAIEVDAAGSTKISTTDAGGSGGNIELEPDGNLIFDPSGGSTSVSGSHLLLDYQTKLVFDQDTGAHTYIAESADDQLLFTVGARELLVLVEDATTSYTLSSGVFTLVPIKLKDLGGVADTPASGYGSLYVNSDVLYFKNDSGTVTNLLSGGGGTARWHQTTGGYTLNRTSTSFYYFQYRPNSDLWSNSDSSPTTVNQYDASSCCYIAPADGTLTNITSYGYVNDTGATDPFKFYVYKGVPANDGTSSSLTLIGTSDAPATISSAAKQCSINTDISSSNTFSAGDGLWVMLKKDSNTGNQDIYFNVTISGEYD